MVDFLATLNFVWQFLQPVGADVIKERLKERRMTQRIAAARAVSLYTDLRDVLAAVDEFIPALERFTQLETGGVGGFRERHEASVRVDEWAEKIIRRLMSVEKDLAAIDPALAIHAPNLRGALGNVTMAEALVAGQAQVPDFLPCSGPDRDLARILNEARQNRTQIAECLEQYRNLVATEFTFKELLG